jgi:PadR family transcriptional regulator, regulatory protein PadR
MYTSPTLGEFEQTVLLAILRLDDSAYAVSIRAEIAKCTRREPARGALYTCLDRLEEKRLVESWFGNPTPERGGRAKRFFAVTKAGRGAVLRVQRSYERLLAGLDLLGRSHA